MRDTINNNHAEGGALYAIASLFVCIIIYSQFYPTIENMLNDLFNTSGLDEMTISIMSLVPLAVMIGLILVLLIYVVPRR